MEQHFYPNQSPPNPVLAYQSAPIPALACPQPAWDPRETIPYFLRQMNVSQWLVLLYPIFLYAVGRRRETDDVDSVDSSAMLQIGMTVVCGAWALNRVILANAAIRHVLFKTPLFWLFCYAVLALLSTGWSGKQALTGFRSVQLMVFLLLTADIFSSLPDVRELLKFQLCFAIAVAVFWEFVGMTYDGSLEGMHTSAVPGTIIGIGVAGFLLRGKQWRIVYWIVALTLLTATSSGSYISMVIGVSIAVMILPARQAALGLMALGIVALVVATHPSETINLIFYGKAHDQILNGTGRVPTWDWLLREQYPQNPYFGFGFGYGEVQARLFNTGVGGLKMQHMHSAAMSALMNLGATGFALLLIFWGGILRVTWKIRSFPERPIMIAAVIATMANSLVMESITAPLSYAALAHLMVYMTAWRMGHSEQQARKMLMENGRGQGR